MLIPLPMVVGNLEVNTCCYKNLTFFLKYNNQTLILSKLTFVTVTSPILQRSFSLENEICVDLLYIQLQYQQIIHQIIQLQYHQIIHCSDFPNKGQFVPNQAYFPIVVTQLRKHMTVTHSGRPCSGTRDRTKYAVRLLTSVLTTGLDGHDLSLIHI